MAIIATLAFYLKKNVELFGRKEGKRGKVDRKYTVMRLRLGGFNVN